MRRSNRWISGMVLMLMASGVSFGETMPESADGRVDGGTKMSREARLLPVKLAHEISPDQLRPIPDGMPVRQYIVGHGVVDGGVAGAVGTRVYQNTLGANFFAGGANVQYADDTLLIAQGGCNLSWLEVFVTGGGNGSGPGFSADFALYTACPNQGGTLIPGTEHHADFPDDGGFLMSLDLEGSEVAIPENPWLRLSTSTDDSGWVMGRPAQIGFTANNFDHPDFPCNAWFGGTPYAGFYADMFCTGDVASQYEAYRADNFSGFFDALTLTEQWADDIVPISAPGQCELVRYEASLAGAAGSFTMSVEIFSHDETNNRPMAPVPGTVKNCSGTGIGGALVNCVFNVFPGIVIPTPNMWLTYDVSSHQAGPVLAGDFPSVGFSEDGFSIFGNPDAGQWSQAIWLYGGCPLAETENPCGTFINTVYCAGSPPPGACCDVLAEVTCVDGVSVSQCAGRWKPNATCLNAAFEPPCESAACCLFNESCLNETVYNCEVLGGLWHPGEFCEDENHTCPPGACIMANNACTEANDNGGGCSDVICCSLVCSADTFCCDVAYDVSCVGLAASLCALTVPNDSCHAAIAIGDGSFSFDTTDATRDGVALPASCNEGFGVDLGHDLWYDFTAPMTGTTTVELCDGTDYDSRMAVYTGCACPALNANIAGCNDNGCGDPPVVGGASAMSFAVTAGQCYKIRIGGFNDASGIGTASISTEAPVGACCDELTGKDCIDGVPVSQCAGRWEANSTCASAQFDPPCGSAGVDPCPAEQLGSTATAFSFPNRLRGNWLEITNGDAALRRFSMELDYLGSLTDLTFWVMVRNEEGVFTPIHSETSPTIGIGQSFYWSNEFVPPITLLNNHEYVLAVSWGNETLTYGRDIQIYPQGFGGGLVRGSVGAIVPIPNPVQFSLFTGGVYSMRVCVDLPGGPGGSCCRNDGSCTVSLETACGDGVWSLAGVCSPNNCPQPGACCATDGACSVGFQFNCPNGAWTLGGTCSPSECAMPPTVAAVGSRYLAVTPDGAVTMPVSLAVTSDDHPCLNKYVDVNGLLGDDPLFRTPIQWGTVYVGDEEIVPDSTYRITVDNGVSVAQSVGATTWKWGDTDHSGAVNLDDILCVLAGFGGGFTANCTLYGTDLIGGFFNPDRTVTLDDILAVLSAFGGAAYPGREVCP